MARRSPTITARTILDNKRLQAGVSEAEGILQGMSARAKGALVLAGGAAATGFVGAFISAMDREATTRKFGEDIVARSATVYRDAWGESLEDVSARMSDVARLFGEEANLELITAQAYALGEAFETDVGANIQDAAELAESFGETAESAMDLLAAAFEGSSAEVRGEMSAAIREYGDFFDGLGFSAEETLRILSDFGRGGAMELDKAADSLKELTIRATDLSESSAQAFREMGLEQDDLAERLLVGGEVARGAFDEIVVGLQSIDSPAAQANAAIALFGTPLEDLGVSKIPEFLASLASMNEGLGVTGTTADELADRVGGGLGARLEALKRTGIDAVSEAFESRLVPVLHRFLDWGEANWPRIASTAGDAWGNIVTGVERAWGILEPLFEGDWRTAWENLKSTAVDVWDDQLQPWLSGLGGLIGDTVGDAAGWLSDHGLETIVGFLESMETTWQEDVWPWLQEMGPKVAGGAGDAATWLYEAGRSSVQGLLNGWEIEWEIDGKPFFEGLADRVEGLVMKDGGFSWTQLGRSAGQGFIDGIYGVFVENGGIFNPNNWVDALGEAGPPAEEVAPGAEYYFPSGGGFAYVNPVPGGRSDGFIDESEFLTDAPVLHSGGVVTAGMARRQRFTGLRSNEAVAVLEVGERVTPAGAPSGPLVGVINVTDGRSIEDELRLVLALHGDSVGMAAR